MESQRAGKNGIRRTKLPFAIFVEHPALILELKGVPENRKTRWTGWNSAPRASCILCCENDDETHDESDAGHQKVGEGSECEPMGPWDRKAKSTGGK